MPETDCACSLGTLLLCSAVYQALRKHADIFEQHQIVTLFTVITVQDRTARPPHTAVETEPLRLHGSDSKTKGKRALEQAGVHKATPLHSAC